MPERLLASFKKTGLQLFLYYEIKKHIYVCISSTRAAEVVILENFTQHLKSALKTP